MCRLGERLPALAMSRLGPASRAGETPQVYGKPVGVSLETCALSEWYGNFAAEVGDDYFTSMPAMPDPAPLPFKSLEMYAAPYR